MKPLCTDIHVNIFLFEKKEEGKEEEKKEEEEEEEVAATLNMVNEADVQNKQMQRITEKADTDKDGVAIANTRTRKLIDN